ncbi:3-isopropylmalate dehydratase large subunit [Shumkonia mesophila]|uniref:3-isopropylmalate dehydratase large subunit n=1 Tax=Shumkonia mesophila TaxID=2838854 RepID=UPI0029347DA4|nr:aconitase/3-isopropylmalate dehydratase large subunit family protein [Shumkonia mesophila]
MGMTIAEKVLARASGQAEVHPRQYVDARLGRIIAHEEFYRIHTAVVEGGMPDGIPRILDLDRFHVILEHFQPAMDSVQALRQEKMRQLARQYGLKHFRDALCGVIHRIALEDYVVPGELALGSDSHSCAWGAVNCVGTGMGEHELAYGLVFGTLWFEVPETIKVHLRGTLKEGVAAKDIALWLGGQYGTEFALYKSIEFDGPGASALSMDARITLASHTVELGGKFGLFDYDEKTEAFLSKRTILRDQLLQAMPVKADPDAHYAQEVVIDLDQLGPQVACPHTFENVVPVSDLRGVRIDQAHIGACSNGHVEDIEAAARLLAGRRVHPQTRMYVQPNSWAVYRECMARGLFEILLDAGAQVLSPGCHLCFAMQGRLTPGQVCLSSTTRNHRGRMGSGEASVYLSSSETVAASAMAGEIVDPREYINSAKERS